MLLHGRGFKTVNVDQVTLGTRVRFWLLNALITPVTTLCARLSTERVLPVYVDTKDA